MTISFSDRCVADSSDLYSIASLSAIRSLSDAQVNALASLGIHRVSDLLHYRPIHDARLITAVARGIAPEMSLADLVADVYQSRETRELLAQKISALTHVNSAAAKVFKDSFGILTIEQLASFGPFEEAQKLLASSIEKEFQEEPSAPAELLPRLVGAVQSTATYSSFVKEGTVRLKGIELTYDDTRIHFVDLRLAGLFQVQGLGPVALQRRSLPQLPHPEPVMHLGYAAKHKQQWVNAGTFLGEMVYSLALAPGESRNIAILDWTRSQRTGRTEDTTAVEQLTNQLFHTRAVDEVTRSTAAEHQNGGTTISAGTIATAGAGVLGAAVSGGIAGSVPGAVIGGVVGAVVGAPTGPGDLVTTLAGAGAGAVIGFGVGAAVAGGAALTGAANLQLGTLRTDSSGNRAIEASLRQNISEMASQKASSLRSLRSNVFVTDEQAEREQLQSRNITNYNHSHMLNLEYFEVLQHYRVELRLSEAEPLLFLPFRPIDFSFELIQDYWPTLRRGILAKQLRERFDRLINGTTATNLGVSQKLRTVRVQLSSVLPLLGAVQIKLTGQPDVQQTRTVIPFGVPGFASTAQTEAKFLFDAPGPDLANLTGLSVIGLPDLQNVAVSVSVQTEDESGRAIRYHVSDDLVRPSNGIANVGLDLSDGESGADVIGELERYFDERRYFFTRLLLLAIEKEQLIDLVEALQFQPTLDLHFPGILPFSTSNRPSLKNFASGQRRLGGVAVRHLTNRLGEHLQETVTSKIGPRGDGAAAAVVVAHALGAISGEIADSRLQDEPSSITEAAARGVEAFKNALVSSAKLSKRQTDEIANSIKLGDEIKVSLSAAIRLPGITGQAIHLSEFVETEPIAITGNTLVFKMKRVMDEEILKNELVTSKLTRLVNSQRLWRNS